MNYKKFPPSLLFFILIIATLHALATYFSWYWSIWWFDILMHFLGGAWIGLVSIWFFFFSNRVEHTLKNKKNIILTAVISVSLIGLLWEVFEFSLSKLIVFNELNSIIDTATDLFVDILGAFSASIHFLFKNKE